MARLPRYDYAGAVHHITARGNRKEKIFIDDTDRLAFIALCKKAIKRYEIVLHSFCLMSNHYHLIAESQHGNISRAMQYINGCYAQYYNRLHGTCGHLFQGRFKAALIQRDVHLMEAARYVVLNPVRAGMVQLPDDYRWSSYNSAIGRDAEFGDLTSGRFVADFFGSGDKYKRFVYDGINGGIWNNLKYGCILGDEEYAEREFKEMSRDNIPIKYAKKPDLFDIIRKNELWSGAAKAVCSYGYTYREVGRFLNMHASTVSRHVNRRLVI